MSWVAAALVGGAVISGVASVVSGNNAADATENAAQTQANSEREALNYLKEVERVPQELREQSLLKLGGIAGLEGGEGNQQELIDRAKSSPLYAAIMGTQAAGEEAVLRNQSATGGLRSGNTQDQLYGYNANLENTALLTSYNDQLQGLQGLAQLPSNANAIASQQNNIGATLASGQISAANTRNQGTQNAISGIQGAIGTVAGMYSDRRLKKNVRLLGRREGYKWYQWDWNSVGESIGLTGSTQGVIADEVVEVCPEAVSLRQGFMFVNYDTLGGIKC